MAKAILDLLGPFFANFTRLIGPVTPASLSRNFPGFFEAGEDGEKLTADYMILAFNIVFKSIHILK